MRHGERWERRRGEVKVRKGGGTGVLGGARCKNQLGKGWHGRAGWHGVAVPMFWRKSGVARSCLVARGAHATFLPCCTVW